MQIRGTNRPASRIHALAMTAMIDVVFLLLIFFIMTFRIVKAEGDFPIRLARAPIGLVNNNVEQTLPIKISLRADRQGRLAGISMGQRHLRGFEELHTQIRQIVGDDTGPGSIRATTEVELDCDDHLKFENVVAAITAVSGYVTKSGRVIKLIEKIKFAPPRKAP